MLRLQVWLSTITASGERREGSGVVAIALNGYFPPDSEQYRAPMIILEVVPAVANDKLFRVEMEKLSRAFETKLTGLKAAHELAQQQLIAEADLRYSIHITDQASKRRPCAGCFSTFRHARRPNSCGGPQTTLSSAPSNHMSYSHQPTEIIGSNIPEGHSTISFNDSDVVRVTASPMYYRSIRESERRRHRTES